MWVELKLGTYTGGVGVWVILVVVTCFEATVAVRGKGEVKEEVQKIRSTRGGEGGLNILLKTKE